MPPGRVPPGREPRTNKIYSQPYWAECENLKNSDFSSIFSIHFFFTSKDSLYVRVSFPRASYPRVPFPRASCSQSILCRTVLLERCDT